MCQGTPVVPRSVFAPAKEIAPGTGARTMKLRSPSRPQHDMPLSPELKHSALAANHYISTEVVGESHLCSYARGADKERIGEPFDRSQSTRPGGGGGC